VSAAARVQRGGAGACALAVALGVVLGDTAASDAAAADTAPGHFLDAAALFLASDALAAGCPDVDVDLGMRIDLTVELYGELEAAGWSIDDARLRSEATVAEVRRRAGALLTRLPGTGCTAARAAIMEGGEVGALLVQRR